MRIIKIKIVIILILKTFHFNTTLNIQQENYVFKILICANLFRNS
jgi:hypothetical protein